VHHESLSSKLGEGALCLVYGRIFGGGALGAIGHTIGIGRKC
jgi:hypothetical protein